MFPGNPGGGGGKKNHAIRRGGVDFFWNNPLEVCSNDDKNVIVHCTSIGARGVGAGIYFSLCEQLHLFFYKLYEGISFNHCDIFKSHCKHTMLNLRDTYSA